MSRPEQRKLYVKSFGCQMNVYDSHRMADLMAPAGFTETAEPDDADLIVLNTCNIREKAAEKIYSELGRMRVLGRKGTVPVTVHLLEPLPRSDDRKWLANAAREAIERALAASVSAPAGL